MLAAVELSTSRNAVRRLLASLSRTAGDDVPSTRTKRDNRIRFFVINNQPRHALDLLDLSIFGKPIPGPQGAPHRYLKLPPASVCNKVLDSAAQAGEELVAKAADLADALVLQNVVLEGRTLQALVHGLGRQGLVERALPLLDRWLVQQQVALEGDDAANQALQLMTHLIETAARAEDADAVLQVLARMAQVGLTPTVASMTSLLQCFMRLGQVDTAHAMVKWMRRSGLQPSAYTYSALMTLPHGGGGPAEARRVLAKAQEALADMRVEGVAPTPHLYAALIRLCSRALDSQAAWAAWRGMQAAGVQPDLVLYSTMIDACAKSRDAAAALQLYEDMRQRGVRPDVVAYSSLLAALKGRPEQAAAVWSAMCDEAGIRPNSFAITAYLDILLASGDTDEALHLLSQAGGLADEGPASNDDPAGPIKLATLYAQALLSAAHSGDGELATQLVLHMRSRGVQHTAATVAALLTVQAAHRSCAAAKWLLQAKAWRDCGEWAVSDSTVHSCLLGKGSADEAAEAVMAQHVAGDRVPVGEAMAVLGGLAVQAKPARALQLYRWAQDNGAALGWTALKLLMFGALNACPPQPELVLEVVAESKKKTGGIERGWWDQRTEQAVLIALRKAPATAELLPGSDGPAAEMATLEIRLK